MPEEQHIKGYFYGKQLITIPPESEEVLQYHPYRSKKRALKKKGKSATEKKKEKVVGGNGGVKVKMMEGATGGEGGDGAEE